MLSSTYWGTSSLRKLRIVPSVICSMSLLLSLSILSDDAFEQLSTTSQVVERA